MRFRPLLLLPVLALLCLAGAASSAMAVGAAQGLPSGRTTYRQLGDYTKDMARLGQAHPSLVRPVVLSEKTVQGRTIRGVELAADVRARDDGRPTFLLTGLTHAREWSSGEVAMEFATDLAARYGDDRRVTRLLRRVRVVVVPVVNPDGFVASRDGATLAARAHRTNCEPLTMSEVLLPCALRGGVDLNRNYGFAWGGDGGSAAAGRDTYRGPSPLSEPESRAIHALSASRQVTGAVSLHNYGGSVLRQPGFQAFGALVDEARQARLGDAMAAAAGYASGAADELYDSTGAQEDWDYVNQDALSYTIELGGLGFQGPYRTSVIDQYLGPAGAAASRRGVREALLLAAGAAGDPAGHAVLTAQAPGAAVLRLSRSFVTSTSPVCVADPASALCPDPLAPIGLPDGIATALDVPVSGRVRWDVTPSTGAVDERNGVRTAWTLTCEAPAGTVLSTQQVFVKRGQAEDLGTLCQ